MGRFAPPPPPKMSEPTRASERAPSVGEWWPAPAPGARWPGGGPTRRSRSTRTIWRWRAGCCCAPRASCRRARGGSRPCMTEAYVELHARSAFSFLHAASLPEDLAAAAAAAGHAVFGLADLGGVYGAPRFHTAARGAGLRPLVGAELEAEGAGTLALLCEDRQGYKNLCRLLTLGHDGREKGQCRVTLAQLADFRRGLVALSAGAPDELVAAAGALGTGALYAEVQRHLDPGEERENRRRRPRAARAPA